MHSCVCVSVWARVMLTRSLVRSTFNKLLFISHRVKDFLNSNLLIYINLSQCVHCKSHWLIEYTQFDHVRWEFTKQRNFTIGIHDKIVVIVVLTELYVAPFIWNQTREKKKPEIFFCASFETYNGLPERKRKLYAFMHLCMAHYRIW